MKTGPQAVAPTMGSNRRPQGGTRSRFIGTAHHADRSSAALPDRHAAVVEGRTLFPSTVVDADKAPRVLVSGYNNAKIGKRIEKGPWAGFPIFTLTLEERATCPATCELWAECMGNAMHMARRHRHGPKLVAALDRELRQKAAAHADGFSVRLHVLGDFYSVQYVAEWARWMLELPALHVWGYTARLPHTDIGGLIAEMNRLWPDRWRVRFSVASDAPIEPLQVTTIWRKPDKIAQPEGTVCVQQFEKSATCGTCTLCWSRPMDDTRIVFIGHGRNKRGRG
jgi:hypothetical protein